MESPAAGQFWQRTLLKRIGLTLMLKLFALSVLYWAFFSPSQRPDITPERIDRHLAPAAAAISPPTRTQHG